MKQGAVEKINEQKLQVSDSHRRKHYSGYQRQQRNIPEMNSVTDTTQNPPYLQSSIILNVRLGNVFVI